MRERLVKLSLIGLVVLAIGTLAWSAWAQPFPDISAKIHFRLLELLSRELLLPPKIKAS